MIDKLQKIILVLLLFVVPFLSWEIGASRFEVVKVVVASVLILGLIVLSLYKGFYANVEYGGFLRSYIFQILFIFLILFQLIFDHSPLAVFGNQFRMQGSLLYILLLAFSICVAKIDLKSVYRLSFFCLISVAISLIFLPMNSGGRMVGTLGEANALGSLILFLFPLAYFYPPFNLRKIVFYRTAILILSFVIIYLSKSSSSMLGLFFECLIIFGRNFNVSINRSLLFVGLILVSSIFYTFNDQRIWENRAEIWQTAYLAGFEKMFTGWGYGNVETGLKSAAIHNSTTLRFMYVDSSHNIFLDNWVQGGLFGLLIFGLIILFSYKRFVEKNRMAEIAILTGLVCAACFNPLSMVGLVCLWTIIGQSYFFFLAKPAL